MAAKVLYLILSFLIIDFDQKTMAFSATGLDKVQLKAETVG